MNSQKSKIVTFYSYKGGVGRSMALANVAWLLAEQYHKNVLVVDWDLEAPGLHRFFDIRDNEIERGLIDLFYDYKDLLRSDTSMVDGEIINIDKYIMNLSNNGGSISVLPAGRQDGEYSTRVNNFNWNEFYKNWHGFGFIEYLKEQLKNRADFIFIDSRTGITDIGGICTLQMPDVVVLLFSLNEQNISGTEKIIKSILKKSTEVTEQITPPKLIIVPSRIEMYLEKEILNEWSEKAAQRFEKYLPCNISAKEDCVQYVLNNSIPYLGYYSFGEKLAVKKYPIDQLAKSLHNLAIMIREAAGYATNPKVFISYSHDSQEHMNKILGLSNRLRTDGIACHIDQYEYSPSEGWPRWMTNQIDEADFVLVVCTKTYNLRFKGKEVAGKGLGAEWEGAIMTQELYGSDSKNANFIPVSKFIPVLFSADDSVHIPIMLCNATHYAVNTEEGYERLYSYLTNQPRVMHPELGGLRSMPSLERKQSFLGALWNVPYQRNAFFTGREDVLEQLHDNFISNKAAVLAQPLAISGLGGIGKTQIAIEYAYRYRDEYKAVFWVKADSRDALVSDLVDIAILLNLSEKDTKDQSLIITSVRRWLGDNINWILIIDNADDPELIEKYLPLNPKGHILLTSRAQAFDNLGIAKSVELEKMLPDEARQFFLRRTGYDNPESEEIETIDTLAQELDYLPLAMEQAGAYIYKMKCSFQDYLSSYRQSGLVLLNQSKVTASKYPESVATTWLLNFEQFEQISRASADLLFASAFLAHDKIPLEIITDGASELGDNISSALTDVENDPLILDELLEPLTQYSLILRDSSFRTYSIHRLVQAVLRDRMDATTQRLWGERVVKAVNCAFPEVEFSNWHICDRLLPHALACAKIIEKWSIELEESATLLNQTGNYLQVRARYGEAEPLFKRALGIREKVLGSEHPSVVVSLNNLASLYYDQGKYQEAESLYKLSLDIREKVLEPEYPDVAVSLNNLASLYYDQGKYQEAESLYKRSLDIREKVLESDHPDVAVSLKNLALLYRDQGKYQEAELLYKRSLDIREKVLESNHPDVATSLSNLAALYRDQGKYQEAEPLYKRALDIRKKVLEPDHPGVAVSLNNLAELYQDQGKYQEAEHLYKQSLAIREKALGPDHPDIANSLHKLAKLYQSKNEYTKSKKVIMRALEINEKTLGPDHPSVVNCLETYATLLQKTNRQREASKIIARIKAIRNKLP